MDMYDQVVQGLRSYFGYEDNWDPRTNVNHAEKLLNRLDEEGLYFTSAASSTSSEWSVYAPDLYQLADSIRVRFHNTKLENAGKIGLYPHPEKGWSYSKMDPLEGGVCILLQLLYIGSEPFPQDDSPTPFHNIPLGEVA